MACGGERRFLRPVATVRAATVREDVAVLEAQTEGGTMLSHLFSARLPFDRRRASTCLPPLRRLAQTVLTVLWLSALAVSSIPAAAQSEKPIDLPGEMFNSLQSASEAKILDWLREGGDPDTVLDGDGNTFMHYAATNLLHILQEAVRRGGDCNRKNAHGATPLHFAASQDSLGSGAEALRTLVRCEASPNVRRACASGDRTAEDCRADPNAQDRRGATPLHAVYEGVEGDSLVIRNLGVSSLPDSGGGAREDVVRVLLEELGADPDIRNGNGDTPLMLPIRNINNAAVMSPSKHVSFILKHGADPDARNNKDATPLIETVSLFSAVRDDDDSPRVVHRLIKHGADPDLRDGRGDTPLIRAAQHDDDSVFEIEALLAGGADPCLRDRNGKLAYDHAQPDGALALHKAGGYPDRETGICVRDLLVAEEREKQLGLDRTVRRQLQSCLKTAGFDPGAPDGLFGPRTRSAVRAWQAARGREGIEAAGYFSLGETDALLEACRTAGPEPLCTGQTGSGCWMAVTNHSGCYIWHPNPQPEETVTWSGGCMDGRVSGKGRATWRFREDAQWKSSWNEESYLEGKPVRNGHLAYQDSDGDEFEGPVVNGKKHGHWVERYAGGQVWEGPYVDGEAHGVWVRRDDPHAPQQCWQRDERMEGVGGFFACGFLDTDETMQAVSLTDVRLGPGDEYTLAGRLKDGQEVEVGATSDEWLWIRYADGASSGYVRASALAEVAEETKRLSMEAMVAWIERHLSGITITTAGSELHRQVVSLDGNSIEISKRGPVRASGMADREWKSRADLSDIGSVRADDVHGEWASITLRCREDERCWTVQYITHSLCCGFTLNPGFSLPLIQEDVGIEGGIRVPSAELLEQAKDMIERLDVR